MKFRSILALILCAALPLPAAAATVTYDFEGQSLGADVTGSGVSASVATTQYGRVFALQNTNPEEGFVEILATGTSTEISGDHYYFHPKRVDGTGGTLPTPDENDTGFVFTISPDAGQTLDFSGADYSVDFGAFASGGPNENLLGGLFYQVNAGPIQSITNSLSTSVVQGSGFDLSEVGGAVLLADGNFLLSGSGNVSLSGISGLSADDTVTFYATFTQDRDNPANYAFAADNLQIDGVTAIPEPSTLALCCLGLMGAICLARRRK